MTPLPDSAPKHSNPRPTRAEIDLGAIAHNFTCLREEAGAARVIAVVKADAYGHGAVPVAQRLAQAGARSFGVALAEEALELRAAGVGGEILVMNGCYGGYHAEVLAAGVTPVVHGLDDLRAFEEVAVDAPVAVHLKVDTGMARLGVRPEQLGELLSGLEKLRKVRISGVLTHLACADEDEAFTREQLRRFVCTVQELRAAGHRPSCLHVANSAGLLRFPWTHLDAVRPGIALYGIEPYPGAAPALRPAMRLRTEVLALRRVPAGESVGYRRAHRVASSALIATLPLGYADGLPRLERLEAQVWVNGALCPIVGLTSMDLTTVDVSAAPSVAIGDEVVLFGAPPAPSVSTLAVAAGTIPYALLTAVSGRVPRSYLST